MDAHPLSRADWRTDAVAVVYVARATHPRQGVVHLHRETQAQAQALPQEERKAEVSESADRIEADKQAADREFRAQIRRHALDDAIGLAPGHIRAKLRSPQFVREWGVALAELCTKVTDKGRIKCINERRMEAARLKREIRDLGNIEESPSLSKLVKERIGFDWHGRSMQEIEILLLVEILAAMKARP